MPLIHGHVHGAWRTRGRMFNVGVDVNEFKPVNELEIALWLEDLPLGAQRRTEREGSVQGR